MMRNSIIVSLFILAALAGMFVFRIPLENSLTRTETIEPAAAPSPRAVPIEHSGPPSFTLLFVGDIMLARGVATQTKKANDYAHPFRLIADTLKEADLTFGNLEGPISARGKNQGSKYSFRADPRTIEGLSLSGFDILSVANNHIWDWGADALTDTLTLLRDNDIYPVGAGPNNEEANKPVFFSAGDTRLAFLAYTNLYPKSLEASNTRPGISSFNLENSQKHIREIEEKNEADIIIVSFHWGDEYKTASNQLQRKIARSLIDAGADLIIGHHPHVIQEIEQYKHGWIAYSLGNFIFDQSFSKETMEGLLFKITLEGKKIYTTESINVSLNSTFQPALTPNL